MLSNEVSVALLSIPAVTPHVRQNRMKIYGVTTAKRSQLRSDTPTIQEQGLAGYEFGNWHGLHAPKGTPAPIVARLNAEVGKITGNAEVRRSWVAQGTSAMTMNVDEFTRFLNDDIAKWAHIVKVSGAKAE